MWIPPGRKLQGWVGYRCWLIGYASLSAKRGASPHSPWDLNSCLRNITSVAGTLAGVNTLHWHFGYGHARGLWESQAFFCRVSWLGWQALCGQLWSSSSPCAFLFKEIFPVKRWIKTYSTVNVSFSKAQNYICYRKIFVHGPQILDFRIIIY